MTIADLEHRVVSTVINDAEHHVGTVHPAHEELRLPDEALHVRDGILLEATSRQVYHPGMDLVGLTETLELELQCGARQDAGEMR